MSQANIQGKGSTNWTSNLRAKFFLGILVTDICVFIPIYFILSPFIADASQNTAYYVSLLLITVTVVYSIGALLFMEILVISRIASLSRSVDGIEWSGGEKRVKVNGNDDISRLGYTINAMLVKLDESRLILEASEKSFRLLAENAQDLVYRISLYPELKVDYVSPSAENIIGYIPEELYRDPGLGVKLIPPEDRILLQTMVVSPDAYLNPVQIHLIKKDGSVIWTEQKNTPFYTGGRLVAVEGIARDITDRKQVEKALRESEEKYRTLVENLPVGVGISTLDGRSLERNQFAAEMHGYPSKDEFNQIAATEIYYDAADRLRFLEKFQAGPVRNFETRHKHKDGSAFWVSVSAIPILGKNGEKQILTINQDIDEQKRAEEALEKSEERYRLLAENVSDVIWTTDLDLKFTYISPSIRRFRGLTPEEALQETIEETMTPESYRIILEMVSEGREALSRGQTNFTAKVEIQQKHKDSSLVWVEIIAQFLMNRENEPVGVVGVSRDISQRKNSEAALRESEAKYRTLINNLPVGVAIVEPNGHTIERNETGMRIFGYTSEAESFAENVENIYYDVKDREKLIALYAQGPVKDFEVRRKRKDGSIFWASMTLVPYPDDLSGRRISVVQDITERKKAETALRESEAKFRNLVENAPIGIALLEANGEFALRNKYLQDMFGFSSREEMEREPVSARYYDIQDRRRYLEMARKGAVRDFEALFKRKDGTLIWGLLNSIPNAGGEERQLITVIQDITSRKMVERQLELKSQLLDAATDSIILRELNDGVPGKAVYANEAAYLSRGYTLKEFMSLQLNGIVFPDAASSIESHIAEILRQGENTYELMQKKKNGDPLPVEIHSRIITMEGKDYLLSVVRDITERKKAEEERNWLFNNEIALRKELENEIQKRIEFTRALVHELKTPLTPVLASSDLLMEELHEEPYLSLAKNINRGAVNLNNRIDELLDLARGEIGMLHLNLKPVDAVRLLQDVFNDTAPSAWQNGESLSLEMPDSLPEIMADEERLRQVLFNLIGNAVKYTDEGGKILLRAEVKGENLVFQVKDTGHGIDENEQKRLFQPYQRFDAGKEHLSGIGLGLPLAKRLVELHKGRIWVESKKGYGSTFSFSIPIEKAQAEKQGREKAA